MPHRIDTTKITETQAAQAAITAALVRLTQIESQAATATTAQLRAAIGDMAGMIKKIIRVVT